MKSEGYKEFRSWSKETGSWWVCLRMIYPAPNPCHSLFCLLPSYHQTSSFVLPHTLCHEAQKWQCKWPWDETSETISWNNLLPLNYFTQIFQRCVIRSSALCLLDNKHGCTGVIGWRCIVCVWEGSREWRVKWWITDEQRLFASFLYIDIFQKSTNIRYYQTNKNAQTNKASMTVNYDKKCGKKDFIEPTRIVLLNLFQEEMSTLCFS